MRTFASVAATDLGVDKTPWLDPVTGARLARARYNPLTIYKPRAEFTPKTTNPANEALRTFRRAWWDRVCGGHEEPAIFAHQWAAGAIPAGGWGEASDAEITHARLVCGRLARLLSDGLLAAV